jgi:hypothetical protein
MEDDEALLAPRYGGDLLAPRYDEKEDAFALTGIITDEEESTKHVLIPGRKTGVNSGVTCRKKTDDDRSMAPSHAGQNSADHVEFESDHPAVESFVERDDENGKFFGNNARTRFYGRFNWLGGQRHKMHWSTDAATEGLVFDNETARSVQFPFSPRRNLNSYGVSTLSMSDYDKHTRSMKSLDERCSSDDEEFPDPFDDMTQPVSPRTKYIDNCMRDGLNPRASLMIRKHMSKGKTKQMTLYLCVFIYSK